MLIPTLDAIRARILNNWRNLDPEVVVDADSDNYIRATGIASAILGLYQYAKWGINQWFPDTADWDNLVRYASARGVTQKLAASALGTLAVTGTPTTPLPSGSVVQIGDQRQYQTLVPVSIGNDGKATVTVAALVPGTAGNLADNTPATLQSAPLGIDANAMILEMRGGTEDETAAAFLERMLEVLRNPEAGGNQYDYERWAKQVAGVDRAFCYPRRRGPGTVDVAVLSNGLPPSEALRVKVQSAIDAKRPPYGDSMTLIIQQGAVAVSGVLHLADNVLLGTVLPKIQAGLEEYFLALAPGETVYRQRIITIICSVSGVKDLELALPAGNVTNRVDDSHIEQSKLGAVNLTLPPP